jgi:membrane protease YdiL (CAAX protease family)
LSFNNRQGFLANAALFEFALLVVGMLLGWIFSIAPNEHVSLNALAIGYGVVTAFPLFLAFLAVEQLPIAPIQKIQEAVLDTLGGYLAQCTWLELAILASLAGIGEEVLFRGFLMAWVESLGGYWAGLIVSSVAFGLMHAITWTYTLFACLAGAYFGWLFDATGERNLIPPIICHALYDFLAFVVIVRDVRQQEESPEQIAE